MNEVLPLWDRGIPFADASPDQAPPSIREFRSEKNRGAIVVCPGGGYEMKADHEGAPVAEMLCAHGISAYVLDYRVAPCHHSAPLADALRAIRKVRSMGFEKVGILGFSAGGHLACSAATLYTAGNPDSGDPVERISSRPDAFVACYPVVSLCAYAHIGSRMRLLGDHCDDLQLLRRFSAEQNITRDTPPAFIWHTASDDCVPVENSLMLASALAAKSLPFELHIYPEGQHGLGLAEDRPDVSEWPDQCCRWLSALGFAS